MEIDINDVKKLQAQIDAINAIPFEDINWTENGEPIEVSDLMTKTWRFIGLTNMYFVETEFYKNSDENLK